ncbi:MAG: glycosyltransferase [Clostridiales bacterium]|jgi:glycosyltransferase involved in cell wall biosynthesis|nr:glycosyltransferase [Clostridiales bacterium]
MKVLMGLDAYLPDVDGVINCMRNYMLNAHGKIDITAVAPAVKGYTDTDPYKIIRCKSIRIPLLNYSYGRPKRDKELIRRLENEDFDLVHIHSPFAVMDFAIKFARKKGIPVVATFHTNMRPILRKAIKSRFIAERFTRSLGRKYNRLDAVFVCSPAVGEQCRSMGYTGDFIRLPFGTELPRADNKEELARAADAKYGLKPDETVFIFAGRLMKLKRVDFILDALKLVKEKGLPFKFFIVGRGMDEKKFKKRAKKNGLGDCAVFTGFLPRGDMRALYARADLLLFPSLYDNFGLVKVEAAAHGTPGLFIAGSNTADGVTDNETGYLSADSVPAFAARIEDIARDRGRLKEVGRNASRELYCSWADCTDKLLEVYGEILKRPR